MNKIIVNENFIEIKIEGMDVLWAMKRKLIIPKSSVVNVYLKPKDLKSPHLKFPGSSVPGLILSGTYYGKGRKEFWTTHFKDGVVFDLKDFKYSRVVIDIENPQSIIDKFKN